MTATGTSFYSALESSFVAKLARAMQRGDATKRDMRAEHSLLRAGRLPSARAATALSCLLFFATPALAQVPTQSSPSEGPRVIVLWPPHPAARPLPVARPGLPRFAYLRLEAPQLLGMRPLLRVGLKVEHAANLGTNQTVPWYPPLQLRERALPTRSRRQASGSQTPDSFPSLDPRSVEFPLSTPRPFEPVEWGYSERSEAQILVTALTVEQPWVSRPGFALLPVPQGPLDGTLSASPSPYDRLGKQSLTFEGVSPSQERMDIGQPTPPDFVREAEPF